MSAPIRVCGIKGKKSGKRKTTGNTKKSVGAMDRLRGRVSGEQEKNDI